MNKHCLKIRPATSADKAPVLAFCMHTWPDGDYVGEAWNDWLHDPSSMLLAGTLDEQPVALAHVAVVDGEGWFEGLRVAPPQRGHGFGRQMLETSIVTARQRGARVLRLLTSSANTTMQGLLPRLGFGWCFDAQWFSLPYRAGPEPQPVTATPAELEQALVNAPMLRETGGLYAAGWSFHTLTRERLAEHLAAEEVVQMADLAGWAIVMRDGEGDDAAIAMVAGDVPAMLAGMRAHPLAQSSKAIKLLLPVNSLLVRIATDVGYTARPNRFGVYALPL